MYLMCVTCVIWCAFICVIHAQQYSCCLLCVICVDWCTDTRLPHPAIQYALLWRHYLSACERGVHGRLYADSTWACSLDI